MWRGYYGELGDASEHLFDTNERLFYWLRGFRGQTPSVVLWVAAAIWIDPWHEVSDGKTVVFIAAAVALSFLNHVAIQLFVIARYRRAMRRICL